jgi:hypothetical protein
VIVVVLRNSKAAEHRRTPTQAYRVHEIREYILECGAVAPLFQSPALE